MRRICVFVLSLCVPAFLFAKESSTNRPVAQVVVTANQVETLMETTPEVVHVVDRKVIDQINPLKTGELIDYANGTSISTGTGSGLPKRSVVSLNGLPPQYTLVLVDGVPLLTEHIHTGQNIEMVPPESIERIEVMRGAASAMYGSDAIGGVVNIITRKDVDQPEGNLTVAAGSHDTYESSVSYRTPVGENAQISSTVQWEKSDGQPLLKPAHRVGYTGYERVTFFNRLDMDVTDKTHMFMSLNGSAGEMEWFKDPNPAYSRLLAPSIGMDHQLSDDLMFSSRVSYSDWRSDISDEQHKLTKPEFFFRWKANDQHTLMFGGDYRYSTFERDGLLDAPSQDAYGAFIQDEWMLNEQLILTGALRYDKTQYIEGALSPKLALLWLPTDKISVRASAAKGFHAPTLQELYEKGYGHDGTHYRYGNPDLKPEYSTSYMLGVEVNPTESLQFMVNGFYTEFDDMIIPVYEGTNSLGQIWRRQNIHQAKVYGVDAAFKVQLCDRLAWEAGATYSESRNEDSGREIPYNSGLSAHTRLTWTDELGGKDYNAFVGARGGFDRSAWDWNPGSSAVTTSGLTTGMKDYVTLDAGVNVGLTENLGCFVKVENILGEDIETLDDVDTVIDGSPFFRFGLKYDFLP